MLPILITLLVRPTNSTKQHKWLLSRMDIQVVEWNVIRVCFTLLIFHLRHPRNGRTFGFGHNSHFQKQQSEEPKREPKKTWKHNSRNGVGGVKTVKTRETLRVVTTLCLMFLFGLPKSLVWNGRLPGRDFLPAGFGVFWWYWWYDMVWDGRNKWQKLSYWTYILSFQHIL